MTIPEFVTAFSAAVKEHKPNAVLNNGRGLVLQAPEVCPLEWFLKVNGHTACNGIPEDMSLHFKMSHKDSWTIMSSADNYDWKMHGSHVSKTLRKQLLSICGLKRKQKK